MVRFAVVPLAYRNASVTVPAWLAGTVNSTKLPATLV